MFYYKTTADFVLCLNFDCIKYLIIFAMEKENVKLDISKYVLTAVIITSAFDELSEARWIMYVVGIGGSILLLTVSIVIIHLANKGR